MNRASSQRDFAWRVPAFMLMMSGSFYLSGESVLWFVVGNATWIAIAAAVLCWPLPWTDRFRLHFTVGFFGGVTITMVTDSFGWSHPLSLRFPFLIGQAYLLALTVCQMTRGATAYRVVNSTS